MKYLILLLFSFSAIAGLPPTSTKGDGETVYKTTFKTDYGTIPVTRTGTTMALGTIPISMGGTGSTLQNFVDLTTGQTVAGLKQFSDSVGIGGAANANAILDVQSTTKAFLPPRMTTTQKNAIPSPVEGMVVYDTTLDTISTYDGIKWIYGFGTVNLDNTYSALIDATTRNVSSESKDFIQGNCTASAVTVCTFVANTFTVPPVCVATAGGGNRTVTLNGTTTTSSVAFYSMTLAQADVTDTPLHIMCQKQGADYLNSSASVYIQANDQSLTETVFSAEVSTTSVVSNENREFVTSCTNANPAVCTLNAFTITPNCTATPIDITNRYLTITSRSSTSISVNQYDDTGTPVRAGFTINCQRTGADYTNAAKPFIVGSFQNYVKTPNLTTPKMGSAKINASGVAVVDNGDMMLGNCTLPGPTGKFNCNFEAGFFTNTPVCVATQNNGSGGLIVPTVFIESLNNSAIEVRTVTSGAYSFDAFFLMCHGE